MSVLMLILLLVIVGFLLWAVNAYIPMEPTIKKIINVVIIVLVVVFILKEVGLWAYLLGARI